MRTNAVTENVLSAGPSWKAGWSEAREHFVQWWERRGMVLCLHTDEGIAPRCEVPNPGPAASIDERYCNANWRAQRNLYHLAHDPLLGDTLPIASFDIGPGSLALFIGSQPNLTPHTVWFEPRLEQPEEYPKLAFDPANRWWQIHEKLLREGVRVADGRFIVGCPDLIENIDTLVSLRGMENLLTDMFDRPEWIEEKLWQINEVFFEAYQRVYDIIKLPDGSAAWSAFHLWAPGKMAKVQCDASAAFGPNMFKRFVVPALTQQCEWLDYSMYHLDGTQCICHLDHLLEIEALDAIEWTPQSGIPGGGAPQWYGLYRRILKAGKAVQAIRVSAAEAIPLLDALGSKGVYLSVVCDTLAEAEETLKAAEKYR